MLPAYALALALVVTGPLLAPGYLLLRDAVSTPRSHLTDVALGLSDAAPRALPQDFAVALGSHVVDGGVVVKALLVAGLWLAGWGAARLTAAVLPDAGRAGQAVATTLAIWNPYVAERLLQGHWSLLVGYGCLPWVAAAVLRRREGAGWWWPLAFWLALAGLTPTGLMLAATVALAAACAPGVRSWRVPAVTLALALLVASPWLVASAVAGSLPASQAAGVPAFAARAEPGLATLGSLAGLGGIWNAEAVPETRATAFAFIATLVLLTVVAVGLPVVVRRPAAVPLLALAAVAVVVPAAMATGPGLVAVEAVVNALPGLGVVRDGQKWVALAVPGYALAGAGAVILLRRWLPGAAVAAVCCAALIATLPDLAWGVGGRMTAVSYPDGWRSAAAVIDADPGPVAVLPPDSMRRFAWAGPAPVLDPLPRWVRADVLSTGDLVIGGRTVPGEGARAREVQDMVLGGATREELAAAGVGWVVVESGSGDLDLPLAFRDDDLTVYRVGGSAPASPHRALMIAVHLAWLAVLLAGAAGTTVATLRRLRSGATSAPGQ
ncbi:hypothetical protein O6P37_13585 [Mycobacterium sp. CPCC 205372]|uniref:Transmembrane protein n=1 Tax=Mycobacterium hippophais TaxID=3016340 RepID=A0ABT4PTK1_9MYCO|nr:hypothetical protein [Mycobacterium hippophais]MCZ8379900.1 hypothetical protein [Mycobacterium hippophais]